ncbi:N-acetyltransferase family protein [Bacillus sp. DX4.1]|uniref:GNAT family N-acetyltransferase n=1 Tax=Bacillus sp. DX4.1 TaxID=3055867 RepID=UPI0025A00EDE|nr:GNAT family N-acetyltransferase [Bacillus sp. DX4.1]MDM5188724.1 N-acetyltransferase family protein [Bacillus sp. DX4.1]
MEVDIKVRDAKMSDLSNIVDIYNSTISSRMVTADTESVTVMSREQWFYEHSPSFRPLWVIEDQGEICGWVSFQSFYGRPAYNGTAEISIYIHQDFRGKGVGKYIMQQVIDTCPRLGIKTLLAFIFAHNEMSLHLFSSFRFEKWAHLPKVAELDGIERDLIILGKRIS